MAFYALLRSFIRPARIPCCVSVCVCVPYIFETSFQSTMLRLSSRLCIFLLLLFCFFFSVGFFVSVLHLLLSLLFFFFFIFIARTFSLDYLFCKSHGARFVGKAETIKATATTTTTEQPNKIDEREGNGHYCAQTELFFSTSFVRSFVCFSTFFFLLFVKVTDLDYLL